MQEDPEELDRLERAVMRTRRHEVPEGEPQQHQGEAQPFAGPPVSFEPVEPTLPPPLTAGQSVESRERSCVPADEAAVPKLRVEEQAAVPPEDDAFSFGDPVGNEEGLPRA